MKKVGRWLVAVSCLGAAVVAGDAAVDAEPRFDARVGSLFPTLERGQSVAEARAAKDIVSHLPDQGFDSASIRGMAARSDEAYYLATHDGLICLVGIVGPSSDRVYASACSKPDVVGSNGLPLVVQRRPDASVPLEAYGAVVLPESSHAAAPADALVEPGIVVFDAERLDDIPEAVTMTASDGESHEIMVYNP